AACQQPSLRTRKRRIVSLSKSPVLRAWAHRFGKNQCRLVGRNVCRGALLKVEQLEPRDLLSLVAYPMILRYDGGGATPFASPGPTGYSPAQIRHAYGFDQIRFNNGAVAGDGSGMTIAIVDAYNDPNIASDLHQ